MAIPVFSQSPLVAACTRAILSPAMKLLFIFATVVLLALSFYADYSWKRWIRTREQARKQERDHPPSSFDQK